MDASGIYSWAPPPIVRCRRASAPRNSSPARRSGWSVNPAALKKKKQDKTLANTRLGLIRESREASFGWKYCFGLLRFGRTAWRGRTIAYVHRILARRSIRVEYRTRALKRRLRNPRRDRQRERRRLASTTGWSGWAGLILPGSR